MPTVFAPVCVNANPIFQFKFSLSFLFVYLLAFFGAKTQAENNSMGIQFWSFHWHSYDMVILDWYQTVLSMTSVKKKLVKICVILFFVIRKKRTKNESSFRKSSHYVWNQVELCENTTWVLHRSSATLFFAMHNQASALQPHDKSNFSL